MARTKKEIEEQASVSEPDTTGTESNPIPQTEPETPPGEVANAGMTDLELAAANTLDPDAPQTDPESGEDTGGRLLFPRLTRNGTRMASPSLARRDFRPRLTWNLPTRIPVPILTWNRLKFPASARPLMLSLHLVHRLSLKRN